MLAAKKDIVNELQKKIHLLQGFAVPLQGRSAESLGLGPIEHAFPNAIFPRGTIHEFLSTTPEHAAATGGFVSGLVATLMQKDGACLWLSSSRTIFPPSLKAYGIAPHSIIFIDLDREKDVLWATEEALKCTGLAAVISDIREISFITSRRLQLAVEQSKVTGFIIRNNPKTISTNACAARWQITPLPSKGDEGLPGIGFPRWKVELLKVRNGNPGTWKLDWWGGKFQSPAEKPVLVTMESSTKKAG